MPTTLFNLLTGYSQGDSGKAARGRAEHLAGATSWS